jgi:sugar phosphate isomerase/epimerase
MKIYLSSWSLREIILRGRPKLEDLPALASRHGFSGVELMDRQLENSPQYLEDLKRRCQKIGCGVILDIGSDLTYSDDKEWRGQIVYVQDMIDVARRLGAEKVRICLGGQSMSFERLFKAFSFVNPKKTHYHSIYRPAAEFAQRLAINQYVVRLTKKYRKSGKGRVKNEESKIKRAVQALKEILPQAEEHKITLGIENHWGISSLPENILKILDELDSPYIGTCIDLENFPETLDRYECIKKLASKVVHVHAKSLSFDKNGEEKDIDYKKCLQILKDKHYDDTITVEYEGAGDAIEGSLRTRELIMKHW